MASYQRLRTWSALHDAYIERISMGNEHGHELFIMVVDDGNRKQLRAKRAAAVDAITEAMDDAAAKGMVADPGEVRVPPDVWREMVEKVLMEAAQA